MSGVATAVVGSAVVSGYFANQAAGEAADAQRASSEAGIAETRRQFDAVQELLAPYVEAGEGAIGAQQALLGLSGPGSQQAEIDAILASPGFQAMTQQGEEALLQNASATGGLRGGNIQTALAQFRPQVLSQLIQQRFANLQGVAGLGQASAAGTGAAAQSTGANVANLLQQQGQAQAGAALARGQAMAGPANTVGQLAMLKAIGAF